jgi:two-component system nitrate/nitrite response regulator NarP
MTRIVLADDHPMIQSAVSSLLEGTDYRLVATAGSGAEALSVIEREQPDIVILDVQMPEGNGIHVLRQLRSGGNDLPVVLLTASIDDHQFAEALTLKADGVLLKNSDPALLLECLDQVREGETWIDPALGHRTTVACERSPHVSLSPRERELVSLVRKGLRNRDIAEQLGVTEGTVKVYLHSVFEKTGVVNRTELAIRAGEFLS